MNNEIVILLFALLLLILLAVMLLIVLYLHRSQNDLRRSLKENDEERKRQIVDLGLHLQQNVSDVNTSLNRDLLSFSGNMQGNFDRFYDRTNERLSHIEDELGDSLQYERDASQKERNEIAQQIAHLDLTQQELNRLSREIASLQNVLQDKKSRGTFGEIELYSLLEAVYGANALRYRRQALLSNGTLADALIEGFDGLDPIAVDSKFPLENYQRIFAEGISPEEKEKYRKAFRKDVSKHIEDIARKYILPGETAEFAFLFLPAEAVYAEIYGNYPDLVELSYRRHVYLVSPTTLMAYLTAIRSIYLQQRRDANLKELLKQLESLSQEFQRYRQRSEKLSGDLQKLSEDLQKEETTAVRIARRFEELYRGEETHE